MGLPSLSLTGLLGTVFVGHWKGIDFLPSLSRVGMHFPNAGGSLLANVAQETGITAFVYFVDTLCGSGTRPIFLMTVNGVVTGSPVFAYIRCRKSICI